MGTIYIYDPDSIRVSFRGVEIGPGLVSFEVTEPKTTNPTAFQHKVSLELRKTITPGEARRFYRDLRRMAGEQYLTPRKRRRIKRRAYGKWLARMIRYVGLATIPGESFTATKARWLAHVGYQWTPVPDDRSRHG